MDGGRGRGPREQVEGRKVEVEGREVREPVFMREREGRRRPLDEGQRVAVRERYPLGAAGRARGVEDVGQVAVHGRDAGRAVGLGLDLGPRHTRQAGRARRLRVVGPPQRPHRSCSAERLVHLGRALPQRDQPGDLAVAGDPSQACRRGRGVHRDVGGPSFHDPVERDDGARGLGAPQRHTVATPHAVRDQRTRKAARGRLEGSVGHARAVHDDGIARRVALGGALEQLRQQRGHG